MAKELQSLIASYRQSVDSLRKVIDRFEGINDKGALRGCEADAELRENAVLSYEPKTIDDLKLKFEFVENLLSEHTEIPDQLGRVLKFLREDCERFIRKNSVIT